MIVDLLRTLGFIRPKKDVPSWGRGPKREERRRLYDGSPRRVRNDERGRSGGSASRRGDDDDTWTLPAILGGQGTWPTGDGQGSCQSDNGGSNASYADTPSSTDTGSCASD